MVDFESYSLKNANTFSYVRLIKTLMERFGENLPKTHEQGKLEKTKPLHVMEETSFQKTMSGADVLHYTLSEEKPPVHILEQEGMGSLFHKRIQILRCFLYTLMRMREKTLSHLEHIQCLMQREEEHMLK